MLRNILAAASVLAVLGAAQGAQAGVYSDDLSKCLVRSTSAADQATLVAWVFAALGQHPDIRKYSTVTPAQAETMTRGAATLFERLLTVDCRKETVAALKYEGASSMEQAFSLLGQVAFRGLTTDPTVAKGFASLSSYVNKAKIEELGKEAGTLPAS
jgi:hypothetical protein